MPATKEPIETFLHGQCMPRGHRYTLVIISLTKRWLAMEMPTKYRLEFLEWLDKIADDESRLWLTAEVITQIELMCDKGYEIVREAQKLGAKKSLDVYADVFSTFATLNPSLIEALRLSPIYQRRDEYVVRIGGL